MAHNYIDGPDGKMPVDRPGIPRTNMGTIVTVDALYWGQRFGLVYVDYLTQQRIPKDSAYWYAELIKTNGDYL